MAVKNTGTSELHEYEQSTSLTLVCIAGNIVAFIIFCLFCYAFWLAGLGPIPGAVVSLLVVSAISAIFALLIRWLHSPEVLEWLPDVMLCMLTCALCILPAWKMTETLTDFHNSHIDTCDPRLSDTGKVECLQRVLGINVSVDAELMNSIAVLLHNSFFNFVRACLKLTSVSWVEVGGVLILAVPFHLVFCGSRTSQRIAVKRYWNSLNSKMKGSASEERQDKTWKVMLAGNQKEVTSKDVNLHDDRDDKKVQADSFAISLLFDSFFARTIIFCAERLNIERARNTTIYRNYMTTLAVDTKQESSAIHRGEFRATMLFCLETTREHIWGTQPGLQASWIPTCHKDTERSLWSMGVALQAFVLAVIPPIVRVGRGEPFFSAMQFEGALVCAFFFQWLSNFLILIHLDHMCYKLGMIQNALYTLRKSTKNPELYTEYCAEECPVDVKVESGSPQANPFWIKYEDKGTEAVSSAERVVNWEKTSVQIRNILAALSTSFMVDLAMIIAITGLALVLVVVNVLTGDSVVQVDNQKLATVSAGNEAAAISADTQQLSAIDAAAALVVILVVKVVMQIILRIACINEEFDVQKEMLSVVAGDFRIKLPDTSKMNEAQKKYKAQIKTTIHAVENQAQNRPFNVFGKKITRGMLTAYAVTAVLCLIGSIEKPVLGGLAKVCKTATALEIDAQRKAVNLLNKEFSSNSTNSTDLSNAQTAGLLMSKHIKKNEGFLTPLICAQVETLLPKLLQQAKKQTPTMVNKVSDASAGLRRLEDPGTLFLSPQ